VFLLGQTLAVRAFSYDFPLSEHAIREAYFLGSRQPTTGSDFLPQYSRTVPSLTVGSCATRVRIETPFFQVADFASRTLNDSAQDAVKDFYGKPSVLQIYLEICYELDAPLSKAVEIRVIQDKQGISPLSDERTAFFPASDVYRRVRNLGEKVKLGFDPGKIHSPTLTLQIDTPDGQHAVIDFDLQSLR
jgi:hypothetical protein